MNKSDEDGEGQRVRPSLSNLLHPSQPEDYPEHRDSGHNPPPLPQSQPSARDLGDTTTRAPAPSSPRLGGLDRNRDSNPLTLGHLHASSSTIGRPILSDPRYYHWGLSTNQPSLTYPYPQAGEPSRRSSYSSEFASASFDQESRPHLTDSPSRYTHSERSEERRTGYPSGEWGSYAQEPPPRPPMPVASGV
jgi:hypothetical protein